MALYIICIITPLIPARYTRALYSLSIFPIGSLVRMTKRPRVTTWGGAKIVLFLHYTSQLLMMYDDA